MPAAFARFLRCSLLVLLCALPAALRAQVEASLVALKSTFPADAREVLVGLRLEHQPHWHTYWTAPGTGLPTSIEWQLPEGWSAGPIRWPMPQRVYDTSKNLAGNGYEGVVTLPVSLTPPAGLPPGTPVTLRAKVEWLMCKDVCIPGEAALSLTLTPTDPGAMTTANVTDSAAGEHLLAAVEALPRPLPGHWRATATRAASSANTIRLRLLAAADAPAPPADPWFFAEDAAIAYEAPQTRVADSPPDELAIDLAVSDYADPAPDRLRGVLTFASGPAYTIDLPIESAPANSDIGYRSLDIGHSEKSASSFAAILGLAFVGGLILNLMPCVFPVLGLKIMGFVQQSGHDRKKITAHGLAFTAGVLLAFWTLGGLLVTIWEGSGWGTQLQNPRVNFVVASVFLLFALSMSGVFEIGMSATRIGGVTAKGRGYFFTLLEGVFITVVATPCSAPLLGTAIGATLTTMPAAPAMVVFTFIALGLASPYLVLSFFPQGVRLLPRPGAWMETLKHLLSFPIYAAVGFFVWVLVPQVSDEKHLQLILALVLLAFAAWLYGRATAPSAKPRRATLALSLVVALGAAVLGWPRTPSPTDILWEPWSAERVAALQKEGRPIYVDFTARWCFTCQTNKAAVFHGPGSGEVLKTFRDKKVVALRADWTNRDPLITAELKRWGRAAVPFNLVWLPGRAEPKILPELLTPSIVLEALEP